MTTLRKNTSFVYTAGSPGTDAVPGTPPHPAYDAWVTTVIHHNATAGYYYGVGVGAYVGTYDHFEWQPGQAAWDETITTLVHYPASLGTPAVPGTPATASGTTANYNLGWTASSMGVDVFYGDKALSFMVGGGSVGVAVGLSPSDNTKNFGLYSYCLLFESGLFKVIEHSVDKTSYAAFAGSDVFKIERAADVVRYWQNDVLIYTSTEANGWPMVLNAALYAGGDTIVDATYSDVLTNFVSSSSSLKPLAAFSGDYTDLAQGVAVMAPLTMEIEMLTDVGVDAVMSPLLATGADYSYKYAAAVMSPLTAEAGAGVEYTIAAARMRPLQAWSHLINGTTGAAYPVMSPLTALSAETDYAEVKAQMAPMTVDTGEWDKVEAYAVVELPMLHLSATGNVSYTADGATLTLPMLTLTASGTGYARTTLPMLTVTATGTVTRVGRATVTLPMFGLTATGTVGRVGQAELTLPMLTLTASGGSTAAMTLPMMTVSASGTLGVVGGATLTMPMLTLTATGDVAALSQAALTLPMLRMVQSGMASMSLPMFKLTASGDLIITITYEAYCVNLKTSEGQPNQVTHYTNYPFNQIVRFNDQYYGVADDGLYLIGGDADITSPISWQWETCLSDLGEKQYKRIPSAYIGGRIDGELDLKVVVGEKSDEEYLYRAVRGENAQTYRVKIGRGLKSRYWAFGAEDQNGSFFEIDTFEPEIMKLERSI